MNISDRRGLKAEARDALAAASYDPKKLILIHSGASIALGLVLALVNYLLSLGIDGTGGLSGVGMRSILETAQSVLMIGQLTVAVFWQIGYIFAAMKIGKGETVGVRDLLQGFRNFGPVLRLRLFTASSSADAVIGFLPTSAPLGCFPQTHTGNSGGQVQPVQNSLKRVLTILSSREWNVITDILPPTLSRSKPSVSAVSSTSSSLFTSIRIA